MDEQRAWIRSRRKKRLRFTAVMLAFCLLVTTYPNIPETFSVFAAGLRGEDAVMSITGFADLPEETAKQTVPVGTDLSELELPDTLEAYVTVEAEDDAEDDKKPDENDGENGDGEEKPDDDDENGDEDDSTEKPGDGGGDNDADSEEEPTEDNGTDIQSIDTDVSTDTDSAANTKSSGFGIQTGSFVMPVYMSGNPQDTLTVDTLTDNADATGKTDAQEKRVTIENITWKSSPAYDGDVEGIYTFTPVLPEDCVLADGVSLPEITVEVVFQGQELTPEQYARMLAGIQDYPELLTEEDILEEDPSLAAQAAGGTRMAAARAAVQTNPGTYLTTEDNENNAGTGTPDGDMDVYLFSYRSSHPIEANIFIPEGKLPKQSCYIAVRTYDVNWRGLRNSYNAEYDKLFINDVRIGTLTGLDYDWNTSYYRVPLSCLREGNNTVRIEIWDCLDLSQFWDDDPPLEQNTRWAVNIDWMQLVCDGGSREGIEAFSLTLTDAAKDGTQVAVKAETEIKSADTNATYDTEYSITDSKGFIVGSYQEAGVKGGTQKFTITMPANSKDGTYTIQGLLKRRSDGMVLAADSTEFEFKNGEVWLGPKLTHTLSPETLTNGNVTVTPKVENASGCTNITFSPTSRTATANGSYDFTVTYKLPSGVQRTKTYTVEVTNIDKEKPQIDYNQITVEPEVRQAQMKTAMDAALTVTDNVTKKCTVTYTYPTAAQLLANEGGQVTVKATATDEAGNQTVKDCTLLVATGPLAFTTPTATRQGTALTFSLSAKLTATGGKAITESGFVWGTMESPTVTLNQGSAKTASPVTTRNAAISVKTTEIAEGVNYYARAYVKAGNVYYYSQPVGFNVGAKQYGTFTIKNNNSNTFTVTRNGGSEGVQTVYYRTVGGSAVGGTHFTHQASTLTFAAGETTKTITITEKSVTATYGGKAATAYSNANRTYQVELYRVTGGGTLGTTTTATRSMPKDSSYTVDRTVYTTEKERSVNTNDDNNYVSDNSGNDDHRTYFKNNRGYNKSHGQDNFNVQRTADVGNEKEKTYLQNTAEGYYYRLRFTAKEVDDGYQHIWIADHKPNITYSSNEHKGPIDIDDFIFGPAKYTARFEINNKATADIALTGTRNNVSGFSPSIRTGAMEGDYLLFGINDEVNVWFAASGSGKDRWQVFTYTDWLKIRDTKEPQLLGIAPMAASAYKQGDPITISLVFDEIVDSTNSNKAGGLDRLVAKTNWGDFTYAGGADTNVLYFTGTVPAGASGKITLNSITGADKIKDMCDNTGGTASTGTGSAVVTVDTKTPTVAITNTSLTNGSASGKITATNADTLQYAWSQEEAMPVAGWFTCKSGDTVSNRQTSGKWYLHALATYEGTGATAYAHSSVFDFGTPEQPTFPLPELTVTTDNSSWTNQNRVINITRKPAGATVKVTTPSGTTSTLSSTAATYAAQTNGLYTFTLTSGGETVVQDIAVEKIDKVNPTATLTEAGTIAEDGSASGIYNTLTMAAKAADEASGVAKVEYAFSSAASAPSSGWQTADSSDKLADGRYSFNYTATQAAQTKIYLYVKVTDNAGNVTTVCSAAYTVIKEPAASGKPAVTLTADSTAWTKDDVTLTWKVTNGGAGSCTVDAGGEWLTGKGTNSTGTFKVQKNGMYMVNVTDVNGNSATASIVVNNIDKEAPVLDKLTVSTTGYAATKSVTLTGAGDSLTTQYDEKGVTGKSGSGIKTREYQRDGDSSWTTFTGDSFTVDKTGTYKVRLTDTVGNVSEEYTVEVTGIDKTAPILTAMVNATLKTSGWYTDSTVPVTLTYKDEAGEEGPASGVKSVEYAFTTTTATIPANLTSLGSTAVASGSAVCNLTNNGTYYLYCKVTDQAGNVTAGWMKADGSIGSASDAAPIKKDSNKGSGTISGPAESKPAAEGLSMTISVNYGPSGGELTATGQTNPIGTLAAHAGPGTASGSAAYTTKTTGTNYVYLKPTSWGSKYYWTYYVRKVTFDSQGGSAVGDHLVWTKQASTSTSTSVDCKLTEPTAPTRTGYEFGGWYTDAACTNKFDFDNQTQVRTDTTLYAKWTAITYDVAYELKVPQPFIDDNKTYSETDYEAPAEKMTYIYGDEMELPVPTLPEKVSGFAFDGWYTTADYSGVRYTSVPKTAADNITYYGRFRDVQAPRYVANSHWTTGSNAYNILSGVVWYNAKTNAFSMRFKENKGIESYRVLWDGNIVEIPDNIKPYNYSQMSGDGFRQQYVYMAHNSYTGFHIPIGIHTYTVQVWDAEGNMTVQDYTIRYDPDAPTFGNITYSVAPVTKYIREFYIDDTKIGSAHPVLTFTEVPTIRIPVQDKPKEGVNASSGLWKLTYTQTELNYTNGAEIADGSKTVTVDLTGQGEDGMVEITLPENWRGTITDITLYDQAGNTKSVGDIGEVLVDTEPPTIRDNVGYGKFYLAEKTSTQKIKIEDKWYTTEELTENNIQIRGVTKDNCAIRYVRWSVNGNYVVTYGYGQGGTYWVWGLSNIAQYTGVNTFTLEVTDGLGHVTTESVTIKIKGPEGSKVAEQTPEAVCDYPADAIAGLAPKTDYKITVGGTTYNVTTDGQGMIPFVLNAGVAAELSGNATVDLCEQQQPISIVKKGDGENTEDSAAQELRINARPSASAVNGATVKAELLKEADDAQISLTLSGSQTWEYQLPNSTDWTTAPAGADGKVTITNLPTGTITLRVKAQANSTDDTNDGWPHGKTGTTNIDEGAGTITVQYELNGSGATGKPANQTGKTYKSTLTKPSNNPSRSDYDFMGWYQSASDYQPGGSTDKAWRFEGTDNAQIVGEILGTDRAAYESKYNSSTKTYEVTLYAGWRENKAPTLNATLTNGADSTAKDQNKWHPAPLAVTLTYSDNVGITKLYVKKDSGAYKELNGNGIGNGTANQTYTLQYTDIEEGSHTYTFKAEDAAGNTTESKVSAKLDKTVPVFGEAAFNSGYKHLWDWIIRKESLTITIPVTEGGSGIGSKGVTYILTPTGGTTGEEQNAAVSSSTSNGYTAKITIPATFKGTVEVKATDQAGNESVPILIGKSGSGIEGVIVESSAPVVTVTADRGINDATATASSTNGKTVDQQNYYDSAPGLFVTVKDEDLDGGQTAAGLASISWKIGDGAENPVGADYLGAGSNGPLTTHSFTIGGLEGRTGEVTVTIKAIDQAGNEVNQPVTLHIKGKMPVPAPSVDYINEKLTGLTANAKYSIGGVEVRADADGSIAIEEAWFGSDLSIHRKTDNAATTLDSDDVQITLNARPEAPSVTKTDETIKGKQDGKIHNLTTAMEYSKDGGTTWIPVQAGDITNNVMENLLAGEILVRVKAKENSTGANDGAPHGQYILAQIEEGTPLTVTFNTDGGSDLAPMTGLSWNDTLSQPKAPVKKGYAIAGWYKEVGLNNIWHFEGEENADTLNGNDITADSPGITLYAKWTDDESPALTAQLTDGAATRAAVNEKNWYNSLAVVLTYSDNEEVTKLCVKVDGGTYTDLASADSGSGAAGGNGIDGSTENGKDAGGNTRYQYIYNALTEGEHTYTFKAVDAAGKKTETSLTAKLDTEGPAFGEASYEQGYKNLWNWIIRKESLIITIPVTEIHSGVDTVEYTLTPAKNTADSGAENDADSTADSGAGVITGTAKVKGSPSEGYTATISIAPDFKGTVKITGSDKAGNMAAEKTIGTDGGGVNGVIVEDNAPQITILADRLPSEATATKPDGTMLSDALYDNAPGLVVMLTDDGDGDGSVIASGLASVKYKVGSNTEKTVVKDYDTQIVTQDTFTIPDTDMAAPAGATSITVTVTAFDQAGNKAEKTVTVKLKSRESTPNAGIGYVAETLTGLRANTVYIINDAGYQSDAKGTITIEGNWMPETLSIAQQGNGSTTVKSVDQTLAVPERPAAPSGSAGNASYPGAKDGTITLTAPAPGTSYEISADGGVTWKNAVFTGTQITGLAAGNYQIRVKAVEGKNFKSNPAEVTVGETPATPYPTPTVQIDYRNETLKGFVPGEVYELRYGVPEESGSEEDSDDSGEDDVEVEPIVVTVTAEADGTIKITDEKWLGETFHIVRKGNDKDKSDSEAQILPIPVRPAAPTPTGVDVDRNDPTELAKLKDLNPNTAYDVSADGGKTWETKSTDTNGVIKGLDAPETYKVRVSATDSNFASEPSGDVAVDSFELTVTFMANGEKHQEIKVYYGKKLSPVPTVPSKKDDNGRPLAGEWCKDENGNDPVDFYNEKITEDMTVYACYSEGHLVTLKTGAGYTLTAASGSTSPVKLGGSFTFKFALADGYEMTDSFAVKVNGVKVELTEDDTYTITNITEDKTVTVEGVEKILVYYTVTLEGGTGYTLTAVSDSTSPVEESGSFTVKFALVDGYEKTSSFVVKVNGVAVELTAGDTYTITDIMEDKTVTVEGVEKIPAYYTVTLEGGTGYTLTAASGSASPVLEGGSFTVKFALADGYEKTDSFAVKVNGVAVELTADDTYTITNIMEDKTVTVEGVEKIPVYYTVTLEGGTGYTLTAASGNTSPVLEGGSFTFKFALADGYEKTDSFAVKVNGVAVELTANDTYTITNITEDKTVTVEGVEKIPVYYTVTLEGGTGYTLTAAFDSTSPVEEGGSFTFKFALSDGYEKTDSFAVKVNGVAIELTADDTYTITNIIENQTVTVEGIKKVPVYYTVTLEGGIGCTLTAASGSTSPVKEGGSFTLKFALNNGYEKTDKFAVKVNGVAVELTADDTYSITNIMEDKTVTVEGVKKKASSGSSGGSDKDPDDTPPTDSNPPADDTLPADSNPPADNTPPADSNPPVDNTPPADSNPPVDNTPPADSNPPADNTPPADSNPPTGTTPPAGSIPDEAGDPPIGEIVQTVPASIEDGRIVVSGETVTTGNAADMTGESTALKLENGAVIVTVVCEQQEYTAGVADTVAVANAVLTPEQIQLVSDGETIEIRIDVKDISETVSGQDKEVIESGLTEYQKEIPELTLGMYVDISMFIRIGEGGWDAVTSTKEPIEVIIGIPEELMEDGREFYIIRSHEGEYTLLNDMDDAPDTITISTDMFSAYAIAYRQTDATGGNHKCGLCHICPTFLGICYFIWLAVIIAAILVIVLIVWRRKKDEKEQKE